MPQARLDKLLNSTRSPTSGGQYHWISQLAPPSIRNFTSYIMGESMQSTLARNRVLIIPGWLVICGWMANLAGNGYLCGVQIEAVILLNNPSYSPQQWQGTLLFWTTVLTAVLVNTILGQIMPAIEALMLVVHMLGFFAVLIPLVVVYWLFLLGYKQGEWY